MNGCGLSREEAELTGGGGGGGAVALVFAVGTTAADLVAVVDWYLDQPRAHTGRIDRSIEAG